MQGEIYTVGSSQDSEVGNGMKADIAPNRRGILEENLQGVVAHEEVMNATHSDPGSFYMLRLQTLTPVL